MPNGGDDGNRRARERARDPRVVERAQVFQRAAATAHDQDLGRCGATRMPQRGDDRSRGAVTLNAARIDQHIRPRRPAADDRDDIPNRRPLQRGHHPDAARIGRQRPLASRIEEALGGKLLSRPLEGQAPEALAARRQLADHELEAA